LVICAADHRKGVQPGAHAHHDPKYQAMVGETGGKDWGVNEAGMKQMDEILALHNPSAPSCWQLPSVVRNASNRCDRGGSVR
jgi:hypothetical protein